MSDPTTSVSLLDAELLLLDGACSEKVQAQVDLAKLRTAAADQYPGVAPAGVKIIVAAIEEAKTTGKLTWDRQQLSHCSVCGGSTRYAKFKSGPRRGLDNGSRPIPLAGYEMKLSFARFKGHISIGACTKCMDELLPHLRAALSAIPVELPAQLQTAGAPLWVKDPHRHCTKCEWTGCESELGKLPAIISGSYPGKCPSCGAENRAFTAQVIKSLDTFTVAPFAAPAPKPPADRFDLDL